MLLIEPLVPKYISKDGNVYFRPPFHHRKSAPPNAIRAHQNAEEDPVYRWRVCFNCRAVDCHPTSVCCWKSFCSKCNKEGSHTDKNCREESEHRGIENNPKEVNVSFLEAVNQLRPPLVHLLLDGNYGDQLANSMRRLANNRANKANTDEEIAVIIEQMNKVSFEGLRCAETAVKKECAAAAKKLPAKAKKPSFGVIIKKKSVTDQSAEEKPVTDKSVTDKLVTDKSVERESVKEVSVKEESVKEESVEKKSVKEEFVEERTSETKAIEKKNGFEHEKIGMNNSCANLGAVETWVL